MSTGKELTLQKLMLPPADKFAFFYDYTKKEMVEIPHTITSEPENVVVVELPHELWLDPIASARKYVDNELVLSTSTPFSTNCKPGSVPIRNLCPGTHQQNNQKN